MSTALDRALAKVKKIEAKTVKETAKKLTAPKPQKSKTPKTKVVKAPRNKNIPYAKIKEMYETGKSYTEIGKATGLLREKFVSPISLVCNALTRLKKGVTIDGKTLKIAIRNKKK